MRKVKTITKEGLAFEALVEKARQHKAAELVQIGTRVPADVLSVIDAMAKQAKVQRSDIVRMLLKAALAEGIAQTSEELRAALRKSGAAAHLVGPLS
jgi:hypothetical protein